MLTALKTFATSKTSEMKSKAKNYQAATMKISKSTIANLPNKMPSLSTMSDEMKINLSLLFQIIGVYFIDSFHNMISSSTGNVVLSIEEQVAERVTMANNMPTSELFRHNPNAAKHVYYISVFLEVKARRKVA